MISLSNFFENPFLDSRISIEKFQKFSEDHLARVNHSGNAALSSLLAPTGAAHLAYFGNISDVATAKAVQEVRTAAVDAKMQDFITLVRKEEAGITYLFGGHAAPEYQEFFPQGLSEYNRMTRANTEVLMKRFAVAVAKYASRLRSGLEAEVTAIVDAYKMLREDQLGQKGVKDTERGERDAARLALADQLWENLLTIANVFRKDPAGGLALFDEGILK